MTFLNDGKSLSKNNHRYTSSLVLVLLFASAFVTEERAFCIDFAAQKSMLLQKLDSLDVEKQVLKRKGQSIEDLEKLSATIKDSIAGLKKELALGEGVSLSATLPDVPTGIGQYIKDIRKYLPQNTFDWIVVVVGFIAIIAGLILFVGLIGMLWKKVFRGKKQPLKTMHDIFPQTVESSDAEYLSKSGGPDAESSGMKIDLLRQRIKEESAVVPMAGFGPDAVRQDVSSEKTAEPADLKNRILLAAEQGADISEISKKFHVSVDQVSLILRVARQEKEADQ